MMSLQGPVLAKLCDFHYAEFMSAPRDDRLVTTLRKAMHGMPSQVKNKPTL
jgi:hypothetical protein